MAADNAPSKLKCFVPVDPFNRGSCMNSCGVGPLVFPNYNLSAQQASQLGPRCCSHVTWSQEAEDKRPMAGLLLGLTSALQRFEYMLWLVWSELWQLMSYLMPHFPNRAQWGWFISTRCYSVEEAVGWGGMWPFRYGRWTRAAVWVCVFVEMRDRKLVFLKYSFTSL